jgi:1,4-dihydroxy-2-naphthoate octaprenyltransferase
VALQARLRGDLDRYDSGPASRQASAAHAHDLERERDDALLHAHGFDNAAAALELGIVMVTASVVVGVAALLWVGATLGAIGLICAVLAIVAPGLASF